MGRRRSKGIPIWLIIILFGVVFLAIPDTRNWFFGLFQMPGEGVEFECPYCGAEYATQTQLDQHLIDVHGTQGPLIVNRKLEFSCVDMYAHIVRGGTVTIYESDGRTGIETVTISAAGSGTSKNYYVSDTEIVIEYSNSTYKALLRKHITVPRMYPADIDAVTVNPIPLDVFNCAQSITYNVITGKGNAIQDANKTTYSYNMTTEGSTGTLSVTWFVPTDNTAYLESYDEIDVLNWYAVLYMRVNGTNYEYVSLSGWDGQYAKGLKVYYYKILDPITITRYKVGNVYIHTGSGSFIISVDLSGYSGDAAAGALYMYGYTDPAYHNLKGSFGPDKQQLDNYGATGFQIFFTD